MSNTPFVDIFGRTWNNAPDHDTSLMLRIDPEVMRAAHLFSTCVKSNMSIDRYLGYYGAYPESVDCYLLANLNKVIPWYVGIRYSDEPSDYHSPFVEDRIVNIVLQHHLVRSNIKEIMAYEHICSQRLLWEK